MNKVQLAKQAVDIVECKTCHHKMVNIDADQLALGDLTNLKIQGLRISNPETKEEICLNCEVPKRFIDKLNDWFEDHTDNDDSGSDSGFFSSGGSFGGSSSSGGFGGFGGGSFSGGGAGRGF